MNQKETKKYELKITPIDNGYFLRTYEKDADGRVPLQTLVATSLEDLFVLIKGVYHKK